MNKVYEGMNIYPLNLNFLQFHPSQKMRLILEPFIFKNNLSLSVYNVFPMNIPKETSPETRIIEK